MIFVTVGTHEQQFNRLVEYMDNYATTTEEEIVIQTGFSTYIPKNCKWQKLFSYTEMSEYIKKARIAITHGGPSSFISALQIGKIPIVVPRQKRYGEHVNDHQVHFCEQVAERMGTIYVVEDISVLDKVINDYDNIVSNMKTGGIGNNAQFCNKFSEIVNELMNKQ